MTEALRSGFVTFKPRARLLKLIGSELISDDVLAITELVKNAHDADASRVTVSFRGVTGPGGEIAIRDDGHGMDLATLLGRWMEPAGSTKGGAGYRQTPLGRRMLGEKGVGRFAADKLARRLELVSRHQRDTREVFASFDWDAFDSDLVMLSDVQNRWEHRHPVDFEDHGTLLRMTELRTPWSERMFRRLCSRLARLRSPFQELNSFAIHLESDEFPQYSGELSHDFLDRSPYRVDAEFDGQHAFKLRINGSRAATLPWNGSGDLRCGPVRVRLFAFDLETEALARIGPRVEVRSWLREWSGVSVYRDGFRVWPYGEPHDDWLRLDQRRVNNPVVRLSNNQIVGFVEITRDGNPELVDQTNREGLISNPALEDLRRLLFFVLQVLEAERAGVRHPDAARPAVVARPGARNEADPLAALEKMIGGASTEVTAELRRVTARLREQSSRDEVLRRRRAEGYAGLAAVGQAAMGLAGIFGPELRNIRLNLERTRDPRKFDVEAVQSLVASVMNISDHLALLFAGDEGSKRRRAIDVPAELAGFRDLMRPTLDDARIRMLVRAPGAGVLRVEMRPEVLHRVMYALVTNSIEWLARARRREISIAVAAREASCEIVFRDSGPGIDRGVAERIFEPLFSGKEGGRGMGLTIARDLVELHGGILVLDPPSAGHRGATFRISLPRKRSRATIPS
jgi:signal transduction histidine kinase